MWKVDLGDGYWYDNTPDYSGVDEAFIAKVEDQYQCHYVTEWPGIKADGQPAKNPKLLFWCDKTHPESKSNWMGMYESEPYYYVCNGDSASRFPIWCVVSNDKQVLFSKYRHDFRSSHDGSVAIDGGREYTRVIGNVRCEHVWLVPQQGTLAIIPETMAKLMEEDTSLVK